MTYFARHISVSIDCPADRVYKFASDPGNLPKWASGLSGSIRKAGRDWIAEAPMGRVKITFAAKNSFGILDHEVILPSGEKFYNPMRVFPNNNGSELIFTLYRKPGMTDRMFSKDAQAVARDLKTLKTLFESNRVP
ncbi:MAG: SRPBCC family protein [Nitrospirae bacterium]|nr:SRPBCC family protein [Nitrospirota bacterium]